MPLIQPSDTRTHSMHGVTFTAYANSTSSATQLAGWSARFEPHTPGQAHQMSHEEVLYVLEGTLEVEIAEETFSVTKHDCVLVPAGASFRVSNVSDHPATAWVVTTLGMTASMNSGGASMAPPWAQ